MDLASARILYDAEAVARAFASVPALAGEQPRSVELQGLWVKPGRHFNAYYRLEFPTPGAAALGAAFALGGKRAAAVHAQLGPHGASTPHCLHCRSAALDSGLLVQLFPDDYRLPTLNDCFAAPRVAAALGGTLDLTACEVAGYRPGMRCQIRYRAAGQAVYGKVAVEQAPGGAFARQKRLHAAVVRAAGRLRVAAPLDYLPELRLALIREAPGESLYEALHAGRDIAASMPAVAEMLAELHGLTAEGIERVYAPEDEIGLVTGWCELVAQWSPELGRLARDAKAELLRASPGTLPPRALVHRDFYDRQVLVAADGLTLLDLDTACRGDPEIDAGNFAAQLVLRGLQLERIEICRRYEEAFLASYPAPLDRERVRWYRRSSLLRLACGYALRPRWRDLAPALIEEATRG